MDIDKIKEIYGESMLVTVRENISNINNNIRYLHSLNILDTNELFESCTPIFLYDEEEFKNRINALVEKLGTDYIDKIYDDLGLLEELM